MITISAQDMEKIFQYNTVLRHIDFNVRRLHSCSKMGENCQNIVRNHNKTVRIRSVLNFFPNIFMRFFGPNFKQLYCCVVQLFSHLNHTVIPHCQAILWKNSKCDHLFYCNLLMNCMQYIASFSNTKVWHRELNFDKIWPKIGDFGNFQKRKRIKILQMLFSPHLIPIFKKRWYIRLSRSQKS